MATGFVECSKVGAVAMIVLAVGFSGISMAGWAVNHLDLAPPYAGIGYMLFLVIRNFVVNLLSWNCCRWYQSVYSVTHGSK